MQCKLHIFFTIKFIVPGALGGLQIYVPKIVEVENLQKCDIIVGIDKR